CGSKEVERLVGETYTLIREPAGSPTRDAKEFGTLINACGRYDQPEVGYRVCRGDREDSLAEALRLLRGHREYLVDSMEAVAAAGATIPPGTEPKFLEIANRMVRDQIRPSRRLDGIDSR